ncbi:MAG: hypothetical protein HY914_11780 [Desulfomonile tiedjei]|nr:hypothetical protein [Desulfomonile tiedjei]
MPWRTRTSVKFWGVVVVLCFVAALTAVGLSRFIASFYSYVDRTYAPFDTEWEEYERSKKPGR